MPTAFVQFNRKHQEQWKGKQTDILKGTLLMWCMDVCGCGCGIENMRKIIAVKWFSHEKCDNFNDDKLSTCGEESRNCRCGNDAKRENHTNKTCTLKLKDVRYFSIHMIMYVQSVYIYGYGHIYIHVLVMPNYIKLIRNHVQYSIWIAQILFRTLNLDKIKALYSTFIVALHNLVQHFAHTSTRAHITYTICIEVISFAFKLIICIFCLYFYFSFGFCYCFSLLSFIFDKFCNKNGSERVRWSTICLMLWQYTCVYESRKMLCRRTIYAVVTWMKWKIDV